MEPRSGWPYADNPCLRVLFYLGLRNRPLPPSLGSQSLCHPRGIGRDRHRANSDQGGS